MQLQLQNQSELRCYLAYAMPQHSLSIFGNSKGGDPGNQIMTGIPVNSGSVDATEGASLRRMYIF